MRGTGVAVAHTIASAWRPRAARVSERLHDWVGAERGRFVPWLAVFMGAGALLYLSPTEEPPPWAGAAALALGAFAIHDRPGSRGVHLRVPEGP